MSVTVCPIALAVGCRKCPIFSVCPVKSVIGDFTPPDPAAAHETKAKPKAKASASAKATPRKSKKRAK